jgi:uncharacterized membrane protein
MAVSVVLLLIRIKLHQSIYLSFLVWNLFLAIIPFAITTGLTNAKKINKIVLLCFFAIWLLFLPNAPYIVTDLLHLTRTDQQYLWFDILMIMSFAFNGLILFFLSLSDMEKLLKHYLKPKILTPLMLTIFGLSAFGIYLGRFLRHNSWEIINNPLNILKDIFNILFQPDIEAWIFTVTFGSFLAISYWILKAFSNHKTYLIND